MTNRQIQPKMVAFLDQKLKDNGLASHAIEIRDSRLLFRLAAEACVGIKEATGHNDGEMVKLIQQTVGGASGEPYCIGGIMTCLAYAEVKTRTKSPLPATEHAQTLWRTSPAAQRVRVVPLPGAIAIWGDVGADSGHGEIVVGADESKFQCVGFNTSGTLAPGAPVNREGNGVFYTVRAFGDSKTRRLLGFLKPF